LKLELQDYLFIYQKTEHISNCTHRGLKLDLRKLLEALSLSIYLIALTED